MSQKCECPRLFIQLMVPNIATELEYYKVSVARVRRWDELIKEILRVALQTEARKTPSISYGICYGSESDIKPGSGSLCLDGGCACAPL